MKKICCLLVSLLFLNVLFAEKNTVQVTLPETKNLSPVEAAYLPEMIQNTLESNLQEYLEMQTLVDSKTENQVKKLQREAENSGRDEDTAIELGKISTAKFAVFSTIIKTSAGYNLTVKYTNLSTGEKVATVVSKDYTNSEYLYGTTGAVDEITLLLADKLNIKLSDVNRKKLTEGSFFLTIEEQLAISKQNDILYNKKLKDLNDELSKLGQSTDLAAIENKKRIEAEKALLAEKQASEKKRQDELASQQQRMLQDKKLEAERSIALITQRDKMAKEAAEKAAQVRNLKLEKQGVLGQINVLEAKKKALAEIGNSVEERCAELYEQFEKDDAEQNYKILTNTWSNVELKDGHPTEAAKQRRVNRVNENHAALLQKYNQNCDSVKQATVQQQNALLTEIKADISKLATVRTVSSLGDELKISFGTYDSDNYGWKADYSLYSDGLLIHQDSFILKYETLAGKPAPKMETASDAQLAEYIDNTDMYTSLLIHEVPVLYYELDYHVNTDKDSNSYIFNFDKIKVINTISGKIVQSTVLNKQITRQMKTFSKTTENKTNKRLLNALIDAARSPELLRKYWNNNIKNIVTVNGDKLPEAIKQIKTETVFIVKGPINAKKVSESLEVNTCPIHLDLENSSFLDKDYFLSINTYYEMQDKEKRFDLSCDNVKSVILPKNEYTYTEINGKPRKPNYNFYCKDLITVYSFSSNLDKNKYLYFYGEIKRNVRNDVIIWSPDNKDRIVYNKTELISLFNKETIEYNYYMKLYFFMNIDNFIKSPSAIKISDYIFDKTVLEYLGRRINYYGSNYKINKTLDFSDCKSLETISLSKFNNLGSYIDKVILPDTIKTIDDKCFCSFYQLNSIDIPHSVTEIGARAFEDCRALSSVVIPDSVKEIGSYCFSGCGQLNEIKLSNKLKSIPDYTFQNCFSIIQITVPRSVETISVDAFSPCIHLKKIELSKELYAEMKKEKSEFLKKYGKLIKTY